MANGRALPGARTTEIRDGLKEIMSNPKETPPREQSKFSASNGSALPCPFCGGEAICEQHGQGGWHVYCVECKIGTYGEWQHKDALSVWNQRVSHKKRSENMRKICVVARFTFDVMSGDRGGENDKTLTQWLNDEDVLRFKVDMPLESVLLVNNEGASFAATCTSVESLDACDEQERLDEIQVALEHP